jgi:hypothetical protein
MGALPQALEIFFEVKMKRINRKIRFSTYKTFFSFSFFFGPLLLSNLTTFLLLIHFKQFKVL